MWVKQVEDTNLPDWLAQHLKSTCRYCGSPMENYYNIDGRCTNRRCSNPYCAGMLAARADNMRQLINLKGLGFAKCLNDIQCHNIKKPIELLAVWGYKPEVTLGTFLRMQCWEGVDSELEVITQQNDYYTLDELFEGYQGKYRQLFEDNKEELYKAADYVTLKKRVNESSKNAVKMTIMITGTPNGFSTKEEFVESCNEACGGRIITIHQKTKRQTGVDCLIKEPGTTTRGKVEAAQKGGIPIITSLEYIYLLSEILKKLDSEEHI